MLEYFFGRMLYDGVQSAGKFFLSSAFQIFMACVIVAVIVFKFWWVIIPVIGLIIFLVYLASFTRPELNEED